MTKSSEVGHRTDGASDVNNGTQRVIGIDSLCWVRQLGVPPDQRYLWLHTWDFPSMPVPCALPLARRRFDEFYPNELISARYAIRWSGWPDPALSAAKDGVQQEQSVAGLGRDAGDAADGDVGAAGAVQELEVDVGSVRGRGPRSMGSLPWGSVIPATIVLPKVLQFGMAETITFRPDDDALRALAALTKDGTTVSNALRSALIDAARVRAQRSCVPNPPHSPQTSRIAPKPHRSSATWRRCVRGDVFRLRSPRGAKGHEQTGSRFAVVVQSDSLALSTWLVAPTSTSALAAAFAPRSKCRADDSGARRADSRR